MKRLRILLLVCLFVTPGAVASCGPPPTPDCVIPETDTTPPHVGLELLIAGGGREVGDGDSESQYRSDKYAVGNKGEEYSFLATANDAGCIARLQVQLEGGNFRDTAATDVSSDKSRPSKELLAGGTLQPAQPGQVMRLWATAEDHHGNKAATASVYIVIPGDYRVRVSYLWMEEREEAGDEPYFIMVGFRSRLDTPGSTEVLYNNYDRDWLDDADDANRREVPESMGVISFPDVRRLVVTLGLVPDSEGVFSYAMVGQGEYATGYLKGEMPEFLGALLIVLEHDFTPSDEIQEMVDRIGAALKENVEPLIETEIPYILRHPGSKPLPGEPLQDTLKRRIQEAMSVRQEMMRDAVESIIYDTFSAYPLRDDDDVIGSDFFTYVGLVRHHSENDMFVILSRSAAEAKNLVVYIEKRLFA